jgi:hypothetical protein
MVAVLILIGFEVRLADFTNPDYRRIHQTGEPKADDVRGNHVASLRLKNLACAVFNKKEYAEAKISTSCAGIDREPSKLNRKIETLSALRCLSRRMKP